MTTMHRSLFSFYSLLIASALLIAGCTAPVRQVIPIASEDSGPYQQTDSLVRDLERQGATVSILVRDLEGETLYDSDPSRIMIPASLQKLAVAAEAMLELPPDFHWETRVFGTAAIDSNGRMDGDLVVVGGWDPSLSGPMPYNDWPWVHLRAWADILHSEGLRRIDGNLVGVGRLFTPDGWATDDLDQRYAPVISSLTWNDGLIRTHIIPLQAGASGGFTDLFREVIPDRRYWTRDYTLGRLYQGGRGPVSNSNVFRNQWLQSTFGINVQDGMPSPDWAPVDDPRALAMDALRQTLRTSNINGADSTVVTRVAPERDHEVRSLGLVHRSAPLDSILRPMITVSSNHWAEMVSATIHWQQQREPVQQPHWIEALQQLGIETEGARQTDACGMSRRNNLNAEIIVDLLETAWIRWDQRWIHLLASPRDPQSTVENRLVEYENRIRVKTGSMSRVQSIAGYIMEDDEPGAMFCIMINHAPRNGAELQRVIDQLLRSILDQGDMPGEVG